MKVVKAMKSMAAKVSVAVKEGGVAEPAPAVPLFMLAPLITATISIRLACMALVPMSAPTARCVR